MPRNTEHRGVVLSETDIIHVMVQDLATFRDNAREYIAHRPTSEITLYIDHKHSPGWWIIDARELTEGSHRFTLRKTRGTNAATLTQVDMSSDGQTVTPSRQTLTVPHDVLCDDNIRRFIDMERSRQNLP